MDRLATPLVIVLVVYGSICALYLWPDTKHRAQQRALSSTRAHDLRYVFWFSRGVINIRSEYIRFRGEDLLYCVCFLRRHLVGDERSLLLTTTRNYCVFRSWSIRTVGR